MTRHVLVSMDLDVIENGTKDDIKSHLNSVRLELIQVTEDRDKYIAKMKKAEAELTDCHKGIGELKI